MTTTTTARETRDSQGITTMKVDLSQYTMVEPASDGCYSIKTFAENNISVRPSTLKGKQYAAWVKDNVKDKALKRAGSNEWVKLQVIEMFVEASITETRKSSTTSKEANSGMSSDDRTWLQRHFDGIGALLTGHEQRLDRIEAQSSQAVAKVAQAAATLETIKNAVAEIDLISAEHTRQIADLQHTEQNCKRTNEEAKAALENANQTYASLMEMVARQEQRLEQQDKIIEDLTRKVNKRWRLF